MRLLAAEPLSVAGLSFLSLYLGETILLTHVFDGVGLAGFKSRANVFLLPKLLVPFLSSTVFPFSSFFVWIGVVGLGQKGLGWGFRTDRVLIVLSRPCIADIF